MCDSQVNFDHMGIFNKKKGDLDGFDLVLIKAEFRQLFQDNASLFFMESVWHRSTLICWKQIVVKSLPLDKL